jgi:hypothetical protein
VLACFYFGQWIPCSQASNVLASSSSPCLLRTRYEILPLLDALVLLSVTPHTVVGDRMILGSPSFLTVIPVDCYRCLSEWMPTIAPTTGWHGRVYDAKVAAPCGALSNFGSSHQPQINRLRLARNFEGIRHRAL